MRDLVCRLPDQPSLTDPRLLARFFRCPYPGLQLIEHCTAATSEPWWWPIVRKASSQCTDSLPACRLHPLNSVRLARDRDGQACSSAGRVARASTCPVGRGDDRILGSATHRVWISVLHLCQIPSLTDSESQPGTALCTAAVRPGAFAPSHKPHLVVGRCIALALIR